MNSNRWWAAAVATAMTVTTGTVRADECLKDTECPSDQICENGLCMISNGPGTPSVRPPASYGKSSAEAPKGAVLVNFAPSDTANHWTVEESRNERVCDLPCSLWVGPSSGLKLRLQADRPEQVQVVQVPDSFAFSAGEKVRAVAMPARKGNIALLIAAIPFAIGGAVMLGVGVGFATKNCTTNPSAAGCDSANPGKHSSSGAILAGLGGAFVLTGILLALMPGGNQPAKLDITRDTTAKRHTKPAVGLTGDGFALTF
jgi:hypothetical protein